MQNLNKSLLFLIVLTKFIVGYKNMTNGLRKYVKKLRESLNKTDI